ncbi:MAG: dihydropteroate synthase [Bacteroidota bacterium]|nr:dihydropteroate synthase [Bacteroidota bacterium]
MAQSVFKNKSSIQLNGELLDLTKPVVMGILNLTPDSFYDGGKHSHKEKAIAKVEQMINDGATFIDIGAISSRPGAKLPNEDEELNRLIPVVALIKKYFCDAKLSIDTFRANVVKELFDRFGAFLVNDISAGNFDSEMFRTVSDLGIPYCMMHMQGKPENMQKNPVYKNPVQDIIKYFAEKIEKLKILGVKDIIIDPGFGFGKTIDHNFELLAKLDSFKIFELPVMVGISRKSMIYNLLGTSPARALNGSSVLHGIALERGANILRVHDIREAKESIRLIEKLNNFV